MDRVGEDEFEEGTILGDNKVRAISPKCGIKVAKENNEGNKCFTFHRRPLSSNKAFSFSFDHISSMH